MNKQNHQIEFRKIQSAVEETFAQGRDWRPVLVSALNAIADQEAESELQRIKSGIKE